MIFFIPLPRLSISHNLLKKSANKGFLLLDSLDVIFYETIKLFVTYIN